MIKTPETYMFGKPINPIRALMGGEATKAEFEVYLEAIVPRLQTDPLSPHPLDRLRFSFLLLNVSRAFQQQLTRHRIDFSYSIQSLRMVNVGEFAEHEMYLTPRTLTGKKFEAGLGPEKFDLSAEKIYRNAMEKIEGSYATLVEAGVPTEDARGVLPLNIYSPVSFSATFRALHAMLKQRLCLSTQGEFRDVAVGIKARVCDWNQTLGALLLPHCEPHHICKMNRPDCRKVKNGMCELPE